MHGRYLLDTNIVIALFASEQEILKHLEKAEEVFLSSIAMGELYYGARKSKHVSANLKRLDSFVFHGEVLSCDVETAQHYGLIKSYLRKKGRPIPENDIWIAATVQQYGLTLVTRDIHFQEIEDLAIEQW